ncbi:MAG: gamma-glutamylcyclotransferase [Rhodobacteraceae bacterium]|nr:gamma-glutamylcyclotransferase [Paracoccaceae bacterium]
MLRRNSVWIFGYGSLIWDPGFSYASRQVARLDGYERSFCMRSIHHRGTVDHPGLVLALDEGAGHCEGVAFEVPQRIAEESLEYLRARELISAAYLEKREALSLRDGRRVEAVTYVIDRHHDQYCGGLALEEQARIIARAHGGRGPNRDYLFNTAAHLAELGLRDRQLDWLCAKVRKLCCAPPDSA